MTGATSGAGTAYSSSFSGVCVAQSLAFCVMFCRSLCVFFHGHVVTVIIWAHFVILYIVYTRWQNRVCRWMQFWRR